MEQTPFATLNLQHDLLENLITLGYVSMTPVQAQCLPAVLEGRDVIGQAKTGSGKTVAFGLGVLEHLDVRRFSVQALVLCPTRELADQVAKELRRLARSIPNVKILTLCGGMPLGPQIGSLEHGAHVVVGTPGRIEEHLRKGTLVLKQLKVLVLDEADRMLEMGFQPSVDAIVAETPSERQTLLFSATYPTGIEHIAQRVMRSPLRIVVEGQHDSGTIQSVFYKVDASEPARIEAVCLLLHKFSAVSTLVFANTRESCQMVADELNRYGFCARALHGDLDQRARDETLVLFSNRSLSVLVATDVAARGLDIDALDCVINFHLARDPEVHVHRIGRTGRAGERGVALSLYSEKERHKVERLEAALGQSIEAKNLPSAEQLEKVAPLPPMVTLQIDGGKKQKVRPGDIVGALTGEGGITADQIGKIAVFDYCAYVAVERQVKATALDKLGKGKLKGRSFRVRWIR
ncbi:MAG: ATP-dependent RNA helicase DbpA [Hahellaceae bacterium]|nr:ATP-dependent RNA helicase DbpA [Hahellaceae bacterium]